MCLQPHKQISRFFCYNKKRAEEWQNKDQFYRKSTAQLKTRIPTEPRAERPQKIQTDELQALLDMNSAQTEKKLAE